MPITLSDFLDFPFDDGKGIRANQIAGRLGVDQVPSSLMQEIHNAPVVANAQRLGALVAENSNNVVYLFEVRDQAMFAAGDDFRALRLQDALLVDGIRFYSDSSGFFWALPGSAPAIGRNVRIWEVNDVAAFAAIAERFLPTVPQAVAQAGASGDRASTRFVWTAERVAQAIAALAGGGGVEILSALPDPATHTVGDVVFVGQGVYILGAPDAVGSFSGVWQQTASQDLVQNPTLITSRHADGTPIRGRFTSNPNNALEALTYRRVGFGPMNSHVYVYLNRAQYEAAKGSAWADTDEVFVELVYNGDPETADGIHLPHTAATTYDGEELVEFYQGDLSDLDADDLAGGGGGASWSLVIKEGSDATGDLLFGHGTNVKHWVNLGTFGDVPHAADDLPALAERIANRTAAIPAGTTVKLTRPTVDNGLPSFYYFRISTDADGTSGFVQGYISSNHLLEARAGGNPRAPLTLGGIKIYSDDGQAFVIETPAGLSITKIDIWRLEDEGAFEQIFHSFLTSSEFDTDEKAAFREAIGAAPSDDIAALIEQKPQTVDPVGTAVIVGGGPNATLSAGAQAGIGLQSLGAGDLASSLATGSDTVLLKAGGYLITAELSNVATRNGSNSPANYPTTIALLTTGALPGGAVAIEHPYFFRGANTTDPAGSVATPIAVTSYLYLPEDTRVGWALAAQILYGTTRTTGFQAGVLRIVLTPLGREEAVEAASYVPDGTGTPALKIGGRAYNLIDRAATIQAEANEAAITAVKATADGALSRSGGTMTDALTLAGAPTADLHAATKAYVDSGGTSGGLSAPQVITPVGTAALVGTASTPGTSGAALAADAWKKIELQSLGTGDLASALNTSGDTVTLKAGAYDIEAILSNVATTTGSNGSNTRTTIGMRVAGSLPAGSVMRPGTRYFRGASVAEAAGPVEIGCYLYLPEDTAVSFELGALIRWFTAFNAFAYQCGVLSITIKPRGERGLPGPEGPSGLPVVQDLPDATNLELGKIDILAGAASHQAYVVRQAPRQNTFEGVAEAFEFGENSFVGTARPVSQFGWRGRFTANPGFAIGALTGGGGKHESVRLTILKSLYETGKGSAVAAGDMIRATITSGNTTTTTQMPYVRERDGYLQFVITDPDSVLHTMRAGDAWRLQVHDSSGNNFLLTHAAGLKHFVEHTFAAQDAEAREAALDARTRSHDDTVAFMDALRGYEYVERAGFVSQTELNNDFLGPNDTATQATETIDQDRELVHAIRLDDALGLNRSLEIRGDIDIFLRKYGTVRTTSGSIGSVRVYLSVKPADANADLRKLMELAHETFSLADYNANATLNYTANPQRTAAFSFTIPDTAAWNLADDDLLVLETVGNIWNGDAAMRVVFKNLDITLPPALSGRQPKQIARTPVLPTAAQTDAVTVGAAWTVTEAGAALGVGRGGNANVELRIPKVLPNAYPLLRVVVTVGGTIVHTPTIPTGGSGDDAGDVVTHHQLYLSNNQRLILEYEHYREHPYDGLRLIGQGTTIPSSTTVEVQVGS